MNETALSLVIKFYQNLRLRLSVRVTAFGGTTKIILFLEKGRGIIDIVN